MVNLVSGMALNDTLSLYLGIIKVYLCEVCAEICEDGFCLLQHGYPELLHLSVILPELTEGLIGRLLRLPDPYLAELVSELLPMRRKY